MGIPCNRNPNPNPSSWGNTRDAHITRVLGKRMPKTRRCSYHCDWGTFAFHISPMFPCALRLRLFSGTQQFNSISDSRVACSRLSDSGGRRERKRHAKSWRGGKKEKERSCRAFSPQFGLPFYFCVCAFWIQRTRLSRSLEQANCVIRQTIKSYCFMFTFTRSNRPLKVVKINDIVSSWIRFILFFSGVQSRDDNVQRFSIFSTILFFYGGTVGIHGVLYGIDKKKI